MVPTSFVDCGPLEVSFLVPPKLPKTPKIGNLGGTKNVTSSGLGLTKLVGTIPVTKKMSHIDNGPSPGQNYGEMALLQILHILAPFLECKTPIFFKLFPKRQFTVYNAEIFFVTSYNPIAWVVKRAKPNSKKGVMWDTLMWRHTAAASPPVEKKGEIINRQHCCLSFREIRRHTGQLDALPIRIG